MEKFKLYQLFCLLGLVSISSCDDREMGKDAPFYTQSYITRYLEGDFVIKKYDNNKWYVGIPTGKIYSSPSLKVSPHTWERFEEIAWANGDMSYNGYVSDLHGMETCYAENFSAMHITSNKDWDAGHPAGALLDDIVMVSANSYAPFIRSGYKYMWSDGLRYDCIHILEHASDLAEDDLYILHVSSGIVFFWFDKAPAEVGAEHTLTITLVTASGEERTMTHTGVPPVVE